MNSPFAFGGTVSRTSFTNRKKEIEHLRNNMLNGINTIIISPRRWGKSSLVEHVIKYKVAKSENHKTVVLDLFAIQTEKEFLELFAREVIKAASTKFDDIIDIAKKIFRSLVPKIVLGSKPASFSLEFDWEEIKKHRDEILDLPEKIAKKKKIKFIICIDEFQNIVEYDKDFEKILRSYWQRHKNVSYCLYGSKKHMMNEIFNDSSKPFYRFGDIIFLPKISSIAWIDFITRKFRQSGKSISRNLASNIVELMQNHSWYVQQLSHYTWMRTKEKTDEIILSNAVEEIQASHLPFFIQLIESMSSTQINLLKAIASNEKKMTSRRVMLYYKLGTPNNVKKNLRSLTEKDIIDKYQKEISFLDPVFELHFRKRFLNH